MSNKILVLGGTGKTGGRVIERLSKLNLPFRTGSRNATPAFDWENQSTWPDVLNGIQKVYITFQPDLAIPGAAKVIQSFVEHSKQAGVKKLVLLSGRGEKEAQVCENIVINSGIDWTIVRASWFMQNFSESFFLDSILANHLVVPRVKALEPFTDADDIADVVVATLTNNLHSQKTYDLTGPELLSFEKITSLISASLNRTITFQEVSMEEYAAMLKSYQMPDDFIWLITYLFTEVLDGRNESLTNDIENVLNKKPTSFQTYIEKTLKTSIWNQTQKA